MGQLQQQHKLKLFGYHEGVMVDSPSREIVDQYYIYISIQGYKKRVIEFVINPNGCSSCIDRTSIININDLEYRANSNYDPLRTLYQIKIKNLSLKELEKKVRLRHPFLSFGEYTSAFGNQKNMIIYPDMGNIHYISKNNYGYFIHDSFLDILSQGRFKVPDVEYTTLKS